MANIIIVDNKIRVTPETGEINIIISIIKKQLDVFGFIEDNAISTSEPISTATDSTELEDGCYEVILSGGSTDDIIVFITSKIEEQRSLFEIDAIKTKDFIGQKDYKIYYDLIQFCIQYDRLMSAIDAYQVINTIPFTSSEIINYFDTLVNYFKYDIK